MRRGGAPFTGGAAEPDGGALGGRRRRRGVDVLRVARAQADRPAGGDGGAAGEQYTRRHRAQLRRFKLPPSEALLQCWPCLLRSVAVPTPGSLYLTPNYLCFHSTIGSVVEVLPWEEVAQLHTGSTVTTAITANCIEVVLLGGRRLTFAQLSQRDATFAQLREVRQQARHEWQSGLSRWRPRRVVLRPPLSLTNLLPCPLHVSLQQPEPLR